MIKARFGDRIDGWIQRVFPFLFRRRLDPNLLTVTGALVSVAAAIALALGAFELGALLLLFGGFFDLVDGVVARHQGTSTPFGAFLDSTLDRFVDMILLLGVMVYYARVDEPAGVLLAGIVTISSVVTSYAKARADLILSPTGESLGGGVFERGERVAVLAAGALFGLLWWALWILAIGTTLTAIQRVRSAHRAMQSMRPVVPANGQPTDAIAEDIAKEAG